MSFMPPTIESTSYWEVETENGTDFVPCDVWDCDDVWDDANDCLRPSVVESIANYVEGSDIQSMQRQTGFIGRLSAPGYLDATDWVSGESVVDVGQQLLSMHGDTFDVEDYHALAAHVDGFDEFWESYLVAIAFTANDETDGDNPTPLYDNPGGDIADVLDVEELTQLIPADALLELLGDAMAFFLDNRALIGDECERAGSDFHFTRNGHGAGFWDGDWPADAGHKLTEAAKVYGTAELNKWGETYAIWN